MWQRITHKHQLSFALTRPWVAGSMGKASSLPLRKARFLCGVLWRWREEKGCHLLTRKSTVDLHFPSSAGGVWLLLMPNSDYQKRKTHQERKKGMGKVMQNICERGTQRTEVYVFLAHASPLSLATLLTNLKKKLSSLLEISSAEKNTQHLCHAEGLHSSIRKGPLLISEGTATWCQSAQGE